MGSLNLLSITLFNCRDINFREPISKARYCSV